MSHQVASLGSIPRELRVHILSYLFPNGETMRITEQKISTMGRRLKNEVERLKNPIWKRPRRFRVANALLASREMFLSGVEAYWGGNILAFGTIHDPQQFLITAQEEVRVSVRSITFGEDYAHGRPLFAEQLLPDWPPSMSILHLLPKLKQLEIHSACLWKGYILDNDKLSDLQNLEQEAGNALEYVRISPIDHGAWYGRDHMLRTIPDEIFKDLKTLKVIWYDIHRVATLCKNMLGYAIDIRDPEWLKPPDRVDNHEDVHLWMELRAAKHWDHTVRYDHDESGRPTRLLHADERRLRQWSTWAVEWWSYHKGGDDKWWQDEPRRYEEVLGLIEERKQGRRGDFYGWSDQIDVEPDLSWYYNYTS